MGFTAALKNVCESGGGEQVGVGRWPTARVHERERERERERASACVLAFFILKPGYAKAPSSAWYHGREEKEEKEKERGV